MRKIILAFLFLPMWAHATPAKSLLLLLGQELRYESDQDQNYIDRKLNNYAIGGSCEKLYLIAEYGGFDVGSGNQTLTVNRRFENYLLWLNYVEEASKFSKFFIGGGAGFYKQTADTIFLGQKTTDTSVEKPLGGATVGLVLEAGYLWISGEARILFIEGLDPNPTISFLGRIGLHFF